MGQRSQIYVRYQKDGVNYLTARYYQWNYGERMISRCRHSLEWIEGMMPYDWYFTRETEKLKRILDVNFDMHDIVIGYDIIKEWEECDYKDETSFKEYVFLTQDNNDGKLFIDIKDGVIKYAFLDYDCDTNRIMSAAQYMQWDCPSWRKSEYIDDEQKALCEANIKAIKKLAKLMTKEEVEEFINADYEPIPKF
jgi:hypothetical protein